MAQMQSLRPEDLESILALEKSKALADGSDEIEASMKEWSSRWRREALEHYLPLGWSFGVFDNDKLQSYVIAKVIPFFRSYTQVLWIENITTKDKLDKAQLMDVLYKYSKEKHLQYVMMDENINISELNLDIPLEEISDRFFQVRTTKKA